MISHRCCRGVFRNHAAVAHMEHMLQKIHITLVGLPTPSQAIPSLLRFSFSADWKGGKDKV